MPPDKFAEAILNLTDNAIRYGGADPGDVDERH